MSNRPEAVIAFDVTSIDHDAGLANAISTLAGKLVPIALADLTDAAAAAEHLGARMSGRIVLADEHTAIAVTDGWTGVVWERRHEASFVRWWFDQLWLQGIGPSLVAVVATDPGARMPDGVTDRPIPITLTTAGPGELSAVLDQLSRGRDDGELPAIDETPGWTLAFEFAPDERPDPGTASLLTVSNGSVGLRGGLEDRSGDDHFVVAAGAYGRGPEGLVLPLPGAAPTVLSGHGGAGGCRRIIDLRTGVVARHGKPGNLSTVRFASLAHPEVVALRAEDGAIDTPWPPPVDRPHVTSGTVADHNSVVDREQADSTVVETVSDRAIVVTTAEQRRWCSDDYRRIERLAAIRSDTVSRRDTSRATATAMLETARTMGFDRLLSEHRQAWARRWNTADIEIDGDPASQLAVRFALFHLLSCSPTSGEAAVGARGLTGLSYAGHVFWDTDVYVLPALAATLPAAARAVLRYRIARLGPARKRARDRGMPGARFPWESADTGDEVTPPSFRDLDGRVIPILTGEHAEHINADIAWGFHHYLQWTGDWSVLNGGGGLDLVLDTARYWPGRMRTDDHGRAHLDGVIGPDEYHELVDDNAFTNNLARWHLRWAAELVARQGGVGEAEAFRSAADALVDGFDPTTGRHKQFVGFDQLEPIMIGDIAQPPVAADVLLGRHRVQAGQIIKQPDVLMLHHMLPDSCPPGSLRADIDHYLPRTAHGSSLSPAICASVLARDGRPDAALEWFDVAARLDLDDLTRTLAGGLHLATMGGVWQAVVYGFAGIRPTVSGLIVDPRLPQRWERLSVRVRYRDQPVRITIKEHTIEVDSPLVIPITIGNERLLAPCRFARPTRSDR
jgi:trehalose/maltose hydrolase-like predicted phosphorylase